MIPAALTVPPSTDPLPLYRYRDGLYACDLVAAALTEFDLFTWIGKNPSTQAQICSHFGFAERPADVMLTMFLSCGFLTRSTEGVFTLTVLAHEHLAAESPWSIAPYYASLKLRPVTQDYIRVLKTGKPANWGGFNTGFDWHKAMEDDAFAKTFTATMDCRGLALGPAMARKIDFGGRTRLLDIAGGSGIYSCCLVAAHPELQATVFEQKPVDRIAAKCIAERHCSDRVAVATGNMFEGNLPTGFDIHLFSNVLHDWDIAEVMVLLRRSFAALAPGGMLVIHDAFLNRDKTGPRPVAEYSALLMHATQGRCYGVGEYADFLSQVGFVPGPYFDTVIDRGFMTALKPLE
ncbi:MAG TPA: methyltransferase [Candidatus Limnocylindria bacterium]|jgi:hypothetical protein|nr:methyltransferase [Candidatus Limnocylindria bacterium]